MPATNRRGEERADSVPQCALRVTAVHAVAVARGATGTGRPGVPLLRKLSAPRGARALQACPGAAAGCEREAVARPGSRHGEAQHQHHRRRALAPGANARAPAGACHGLLWLTRTSTAGDPCNTHARSFVFASGLCIYLAPKSDFPKSITFRLTRCAPASARLSACRACTPPLRHPPVAE